MNCSTGWFHSNSFHLVSTSLWTRPFQSAALIQIMIALIGWPPLFHMALFPDYHIIATNNQIVWFGGTLQGSMWGKFDRINHLAFTMYSICDVRKFELPSTSKIRFFYCLLIKYPAPILVNPRLPQYSEWVAWRSCHAPKFHHCFEPWVGLEKGLGPQLMK